MKPPERPEPHEAPAPTPVTLPHPGRVRVSTDVWLTGTVPCTVEKETKKSYWVRWARTIPLTRIREGEVMPVLKKHVELDPT